jgi:hypothetical protein
MALIARAIERTTAAAVIHLSETPRRPRLGLRSAAPAPSAAAPRSEPEPEPGLALPPAERVRSIARLVGGSFDDSAIAPTVVFPDAPQAAQAAQAAQPAPISIPSPTPPAPAAEPRDIDLDEVYEHVAARLRRELLHDRERIGDLVGNLTPHGFPR